MHATAVSPEFLDRFSKNVSDLFQYAFEVHESNDIPRIRNLAERLKEFSNSLGEMQTLVANCLRDRGVAAIAGNAVERPVTLEKIRETFYNAIPDAMRYGFEKKLFTPDHVEDGLFIQTALPALTLILVMENSRDVKDGIMLRDRVTVVTKQNCPDELKFLLKHLLRVKEDICELPPEPAMHLKIACVNDPDKKLPEDTPNYEEIAFLATCINRVAGKIMQRDRYKELMNHVLQISLVAAKEK